MTSPEQTPAAPAAVAGRRSTEGRNTHGVAGLGRLVEDRVHAAFPHRIWVTGEVVDVRTRSDGGVRFALAEDGEDGPSRLSCVLPAAAVPDLRDLLLRDHDAEVSDVVVEGRTARAGGLLRFGYADDALVLTVSDLDPTPTRERLEQDRASAAAAVREGGLPEAQRARAVPVAPLRVGVVALPDDERAARAVQRLAVSPYLVAVDVALVAPQHASSAAGLAEAVRAAARRNDVVLLLRGEGRPLLLGLFDAPEVARAVVEAPVPVLTGLGGRGEQTACDLVAAAAHRTADAAVDSVLTRLREADERLVAVAAQVEQDVDAAYARAGTALAGSAQHVDAALAEAQVRAAAADRRRRLLGTALAALLAVAVVVITLVTEQPLVLLALVLPALVLVAVRGSLPFPTRSSPVSQHSTTFDDVLARLEEVRARLASTSSPEEVERLRADAARLVARGEQVLRRDEDAPAAPPAVRTLEPVEQTPPGQPPA